MSDNILIVGAGFAGAVYARQLAEKDYYVTVIDKRDHIAGNCYDYVDNSGIRIHKYGPHLFHTSNMAVFDYLSRFTKWVKYEHKVVVRVGENKLVPLPINIHTINAIFNKSFESEEDVKSFVDSLTIKNQEIINAQDWLYDKIGERLTNIFYRPYTKKMWDLDLKNLSYSVVKRIKFSFSNEERYFPNDSIQFLPDKGYTELFRNLLDHKNINICLSEKFSKSSLKEFTYCFNSMPIDEYYDFKFGNLPYRSIKFKHMTTESDTSSGHVTINYSDSSKHTRETWWHNIPGHHIQRKDLFIKTQEEPCDYKDNNYERYYPVKTSDDKFGRIYKKYRDLKEENIVFIGRCGTYQYLDMHQVVNQSLLNVNRWIKDHE